VKKGIVTLCLAFAFTLGLVLGPAWAYQCPGLYQECQEQLKTTKNDKAKSLCEQGIKLHDAGKHDEAVEKLNAGLALFKK
jgi:outer membrane protein assembly factor BamD (BamD/ComL family)